MILETIVAAGRKTGIMVLARLMLLSVYEPMRPNVDCKSPEQVHQYGDNSMKRILAYSVIGAFLASAPVAFAANNSAVASDAPQVQKQEVPAATVKAAPANDTGAITAKTVKAEPEAQASPNKLGTKSLSAGKKVEKKDAAKPEVEKTKVTKADKKDADKSVTAKPEAEKATVAKVEKKDAGAPVTVKPEAAKTTAAVPATAAKTEPAKVN